MNKQSVLQAVKFTLFSASAGLIQAVTFVILKEIFKTETYALTHLPALVLSVLWNFTLNRRFTFKSAANVPVAMAKIFGFYLVFTPLSTWLGTAAVDAWKNDFNAGYIEYIVEGISMLCNLVLEYLFCKFVVYRNQENTLEKQ